MCFPVFPFRLPIITRAVCQQHCVITGASPNTKFPNAFSSKPSSVCQYMKRNGCTSLWTGFGANFVKLYSVSEVENVKSWYLQ